MKFNLIVNSQQQDGFKLSFVAENNSEIEIAKGLTEKLIEKITKIEVTVQNNYE